MSINLYTVISLSSQGMHTSRIILTPRLIDMGSSSGHLLHVESISLTQGCWVEKPPPLKILE